MTEKPIIMSAESVRAILAGRKTQTRRVIKPQPHAIIDGLPYVDNPVQVVDEATNKTVWRFSDDAGRRLIKPVRCPYQVGDRLWVRETWKKSLHGGEYDADGAEYVHDCPGYKADGKYRCGKPVNDLEYGWQSPIHMPRWASRLTLEVVESWPERLHDITEEGAIAEGCVPYIDPFENIQIISVTQIYAQLWEALNAKRGYPWDANPWVWVITFKVVTL
jgi:hypothetical protein